MRALAFALALLTSLAQAQGDWPKREVKILVGFYFRELLCFSYLGN